MIPQPAAKSLALRLLDHRAMESRTGYEYLLPWVGRVNPFVVRRARKTHRTVEGNPISLRQMLSEAQNHRCCYCGVRTTGRDDAMATIEHITPRSHGGTNDRVNLVMACRRCNSMRGVENAYDFFERQGWMTTPTPQEPPHAG